MAARSPFRLAVLLIVLVSPAYAAEEVGGRGDPVSDGISAIEKLARERELRRASPVVQPAPAGDKPAVKAAPLPPVAALPLPSVGSAAAADPVVEAVRGAGGTPLKATLRYPDGTRAIVSVGSSVGRGKVTAVTREGVTVEDQGKKQIMRFSAVRPSAASMMPGMTPIPMMPSIPMTPAGPMLPRP